MRIHPLRLLRLAIFLLLILPILRTGDLKPLVPTVVPKPEIAITASSANPEKQSRVAINEDEQPQKVRQRDKLSTLVKHLDLGKPVKIQIGNDASRKAWLRPFVPVVEEFQITLGNNKSDVMDVTRPKAWRGFVENFKTSISITHVGDSWAAHITEPDGTTHSIYEEPKTGKLIAETKLQEYLDYLCRLDPRTRISTTSATQDLEESKPIIQAASIEALNNQAGQNPATNEYDRALDFSPGGQLYEDSLKSSYLLLVLDKSATGSDDEANLSSVTAQYLARLAGLSAIYEQQLGTRLLVQELILIPDTGAYTDIPFFEADNNQSIKEFREWVELNRPLVDSPHTFATKVGAGLSGSTLGLAYTNTAGTILACNLIREGYDYALHVHEIGHNLGTSHTTGGVMNASYIAGQNSFYTFSESQLTAAKHIYDASKNDLEGPAELRNPQEIPFALNDFARTDPDKAVTLSPLENDLSSVPGGQINTELEIAETGPVFPIGSGTLEQDGNTLTFTPIGDYQGLVWFSYSLRGNVGNEGEGWLHKADIAVLVGELQDAESPTILPGDTFVHIPNGSGDVTLGTLPNQANATISLDDPRAIIIHANEDASGSDSLNYIKNSQTYTLTIHYSAENTIETQPDVFILSLGESSIRFNPTHNDAFSGNRSSHSVQPTLGTTDTITDLLPNGYTLTSATLETADKGTLELEKHSYFVSGSTQQRNTGFLTFTPRSDATGIAEITYVLKDSTDNTASETVLIYLPLHSITTPKPDSFYIRDGNDLKLEFASNATPVPEITGDFTHQWSVLSKPLHAEATLLTIEETKATVSFSHTGTYSLELRTEDAHGRFNSSIRTIHVISADETPEIGVSVGPDITLPTGVMTIPNAILSTGTFSPNVVDTDGPAFVPHFEWIRQSGPGTVAATAPNSVQSFFQFSTEGQYVLRLSADDGDIHTFRDVSIDYEVANAGTPTAIGIAPIQLPINSGLYSVDLGKLFEDSEDADEDLSYTLLSPQSSALLQTLQITSSPDQLQIQPATNQTGTVQISIQATDTQGEAAIVLIEVEISNHPPTLSDVSITLNENTANDAVATTLSAENPDGDTLEFSIMESTPYSDTFSLHPDTGTITVANSENLDFETAPVHSLVVSVTDTHQLHTPRTATITINLNDINEAPSLESEILTVTTLETEEFVLKTLTPSDPENDEVFLEIIDGNDDGRYSLDAEFNLLFNPLPAFDIYTTPRHILTLEVTDAGSPPITTETTLQIDFHECLNPPETFQVKWYSPRNSARDEDWITLHLNDNRWPSGKMPLGYDTSANYDPYIETDIQANMYQRTSSTYVRIPFEIADTSKIGSMYLMADFDDGIAVYLNGNTFPILRKNAPSSLAYNAVASADQSATPPDQVRYDLKDNISLLINGSNLLCIHLLNSHSHDADAYLNAQLYVSAIGTASAPGAPSIQISGAGFPGRTSLTPSGTILNNGGEQPSVFLVLDTEDKGQNPDLWTHKFPLADFIGNSFQQSATGLLPGVTYHYGFYAENSGGIGWTSTNNTSSTRSNKPPVPEDDSLVATGGTPLVVELANSLLNNDTDPESDSLAATLLTPPQHGSLQLNSDGTLTYTSDPSFSGVDSFQYLATDSYDFAETDYTWITKGDSWKYLDNNTALNFTWRRLTFDDSSWSTGNAEFGYGDSDEATTLSYGADANEKTPTYYFRKTFTLPDDAYVLDAKVSVKRDDAVVLSLNGIEFHRDENLGHTYTHSNYASAETTVENTYALVTVPTDHLQPGDNILAAEVHIASPTDDDLSFDLELSGTLRQATTVTITVSGSDPTADEDNDGLSNFLEFALGSNPSQTTPHSEVAPTINFSGSTIDFIYTRAQTSLTYTVESSNNLLSWQESTALFTNISDNGNGTETVTHTYSRSGSENMFLRIMISDE